MQFYIPNPRNLITIATPLFIAGVVCLYKTWDAIAWILIGLGCVATFLIAWALIWDVFIRKANAIQYLFDSAKYLDRERTNDLLYAMGLKPLPPQQHTTTAIVNKQQGGVTTNTKIYTDIPASPAQLEKLAIGLLIDKAPFSRREWTGELERAKVFTQTEFNTLGEYCDRKKLRTPSAKTNTYEPTQDFIDFLQSYLPSPTPQMETA